MKTIAIIHDIGYADVDYVMSSLDYINRIAPRTFEGEFTIILPHGSVFESLFKDAGMPVQIVSEWPEQYDLLVGFSNWDEASPACEIIMERWRNARPVYPFKVTV